jgi:hypothetical protein
MDDHDLNTKLGNYCQTCVSRHERHKQSAATARAQIGNGGGDFADEVHENEARAEDVQAHRWGVHAKHAAEGRFSYHSDRAGIGHQMEYSDLKGHADREFRSVELDDHDTPVDHNRTV